MPSSCPHPFTLPLRLRVSSSTCALAAAALLGAAVAACTSTSNNAAPKADGAAGAPSDASTDHGGGGGSGGGKGGTGGVDAATDAPAADVPNVLCEGVSPAFDYDSTGDGIVANFDGFGNLVFGSTATTFTASGGTYVSSGLTEDFSNANWHLTGTVADGLQLMGFWWQCATPTTGGGCTLDLSRFKGIRFTVSGNAGPDNALLFTLGRADNDPADKNAMCGSCALAVDASEEGHCVGPSLQVPVAASGSASIVTVLWTDFHDGIPNDSIDPHQITGIQWRFHAPPGLDGGVDAGLDAAEAGSSGGAGDDGGSASDAGDGGPTGPFYLGDITIDDVVLVPY